VLSPRSSPSSLALAWHSGLLALGLALAACIAAPARPRLAPEDYPGVLRAPAALGREVLWRQRVTARWGDGQVRGFDAVVQQRAGALTVVGLSPVGAVGFAVVLEGEAVRLQDHLPEGMPIPPRFLLLDVQRALYPWLPGAGTPRADGEHAGTVDGERVVERWESGRLLERVFTRLDGTPPGAIRVRYEGGFAPGARPPRLALENGWFGYRLEVDTLGEELLDAETTP